MKIIATDIANLTDARYFAAWHVEMMCYGIEPDTEGNHTPARLKEIVEWVEGPQTGIKMTGLTVPETMAEVDFEVENVIIGPFIDKNDLPASVKNVYRICTLQDGWQDESKIVLTIESPISQLSQGQCDKIKEISQSREVYIDAAFTVADLEDISALNVTGIILKGGEEEKVGYKSFDELDEVLEALFEEI